MTAHTTSKWAVEYRERDGDVYLRHRCDSADAMTFSTRAAARKWLDDHKLRDARVVPVTVTVAVRAA